MKRVTVTAKRSTKSQAVIPKPVRHKLGVGPGDLVEFEIVRARC